jgi:hypothetical protein
MKRLFVLIMVLVPMQIFAQFARHEHREYYVKQHTANLTTVQTDTFRITGGGTAADTLWEISSTNIDTSRVYETWPYMSMGVFLDDTTTDDSAAWEIKVFLASETEYSDGAVPGFSEFILHDSLTVADEVPVWFVMTDSSPSYPNAQYMYFTAQGTADNNIVGGAVQGRLKFVGWDDTRTR